MTPRIVLTLAAAGSVAASSFAGPPRDAVVRITSHGASGVVVYSAPGHSLILSAGHAFDNAARLRPIVLDVPSDGPASVETGDGTKAIVSVDYDADLALVHLGRGPLAAVCPVATSDPVAGAGLVSCGYDGMRWPQTYSPARIVGSGPGMSFTDTRPTPGRSGGALIDPARQELVGIVCGYETSGSHRGVYASRSSCIRFLERAARLSWGVLQPGEGRGERATPNVRPFPPDPRHPIWR